MREIKFRAWDYGSDPAKKLNVKGKMVEVDYLTWSKNCLEEINQEMPKWFSPLMQYTGLKDKNGVEIYEGDVVDLGRKDNSKPVVVTWLTECFCWKGVYVGEYQKYIETQKNWIRISNNGGHNADFGWMKNHNTLEIIGNIYENPELIEI